MDDIIEPKEATILWFSLQKPNMEAITAKLTSELNSAMAENKTLEANKREHQYYTNELSKQKKRQKKLNDEEQKQEEEVYTKVSDNLLHYGEFLTASKRLLQILKSAADSVETPLNTKIASGPINAVNILNEDERRLEHFLMQCPYPVRIKKQILEQTVADLKTHLEGRCDIWTQQGVMIKVEEKRLIKVKENYDAVSSVFVLEIAHAKSQLEIITSMLKKHNLEENMDTSGGSQINQPASSPSNYSQNPGSSQNSGSSQNPGYSQAQIQYHDIPPSTVLYYETNAADSKRTRFSPDREEISKKMKYSEQRNRDFKVPQDVGQRKNPTIEELEEMIVWKQKKVLEVVHILAAIRYSTKKGLAFIEKKKVNREVVRETEENLVGGQIPVPPIIPNEQPLPIRDPSSFVLKPIGICNPEGLFCYMNSVVQALANIPIFSVAFVCAYDSNGRQLQNALYHLYKHMFVKKSDPRTTNNRPPVLAADELRSYYRERRTVKFPLHRQHDAEEFLDDLITELKGEANLMIEDPDGEIRPGYHMDRMQHMFSGYTRSPLGVEEPFGVLRLPIVNTKVDTIEKALQRYLHVSEPQISVEIERLAIPGTSTERVSPSKERYPCLKALLFDDKEPPKTMTTPLILCLSVIRRTKVYNFNTKPIWGGDFSIPGELTVDNKPVKYILKSVVHYIQAGSSPTGHYWTYIKTDNRDYFKLNDQVVTSISETDFVLAAHDGNCVIFMYALHQ